MIGNQTPSVQTTSMKLADLKRALEAMHSALVAFSGGVDSTFLLAMAKRTLKDQVVAVTGDSPIHSERERRDAVLLAEKLNVRHIIIPTREMELEAFKKNPVNRCYVCKKNLISQIKKLAEFPDTVYGSAIDREPHSIARYLQDLASSFHTFYSKCRVLDDENVEMTRARALLADCVRKTLRNGLTLMGISAPTSM